MKFSFFLNCRLICYLSQFLFAKFAVKLANRIPQNSNDVGV